MLLIILTIGAVALTLLSLVVGVTVLIFLLRLTRRFDGYDAVIDDLKRANVANTKEIGERVSANQSLLRKRIDHLEDEIKRHSSRIDLFKKQVSSEISEGVQTLDNRLATLAADDEPSIGST